MLGQIRCVCCKYYRQPDLYYTKDNGTQYKSCNSCINRYRKKPDTITCNLCKRFLTTNNFSTKPDGKIYKSCTRCLIKINLEK